jgi:SAM-dependent methyltransferase
MLNGIVIKIRQWRRKLRWLLGRGWSAEDFAQRYGNSGGDAWGYRGASKHERRAEWIVSALPARRFTKALEVGCAQGFLTERFAERADRVIACDISAEAIRQAQENCKALSQVEFRVADIRAGFPDDGFDLCLFSDVLYYLSPRETDAVLKSAAQRTTANGVLLIVNEWSAHARGLTPPTYAFGKLDGDPRWEKGPVSQAPFGEGELSMRLYFRRPSGA